MTDLFKRYLTLFLSLIILLNFHPVSAASFNEDLREIRAEINRDNLQEAIKKITNGELIACLKDNVSQEAFTQNREQDPMLAGDPDKVLMSYR